MMNDGGRVGGLRFDADRVRRFASVEPGMISIRHHFRPEPKRVEAYKGAIRVHYPTPMSEAQTKLR